MGKEIKLDFAANAAKLKSNLKTEQNQTQENENCVAIIPFPINPQNPTIDLPSSARIMDIRSLNGMPTLICMVDLNDTSKEPHTFGLVMPGQKIRKEDLTRYSFIGVATVMVEVKIQKPNMPPYQEMPIMVFEKVAEPNIEQSSSILK